MFSRPVVTFVVPAVLGRFLFALNHFCKERYAMEDDVPDYSVYEFAKASSSLQSETTRALGPVSSPAAEA